MTTVPPPAPPPPRFCDHCGAPLREVRDGACPFCKVPLPGSAPVETGVFDVVVLDIGRKKIEVIKVVREITGFGLKEAKDAVEYAERGVAPLGSRLPRADAEALAESVSRAGATVEVRPSAS